MPSSKSTIVLAVDSFKGSASSAQIESWLDRGITGVIPGTRVVSLPVADGGEGTVDAFLTLDGTLAHKVWVTGPLGEPAETSFAMLDEQTAVIEVAQSCGIMLTDRTSSSARRASSYGVGEQLLAAVHAGARRVYVGLGGSATSDGGAGMAKALGIRMLDCHGCQIPCGLEGLRDLASIDVTGYCRDLAGVEIIALTDVTNPLVGDDGSVRIYGPQKGIAACDFDMLDSWMRHYAELLHEVSGIDVAQLPGAGAAGGIAAALVALCGARIERGAEAVLDISGFDSIVRHANLVITGEGCLDSQTISGKVPVSVAARAKRFEKPVIAVVGGRSGDMVPVYEAGIDAVLPVVPGPVSLDDAITGVEENVVATGETIARILRVANWS